jgi:hypothetical protein
MFVTSRPQPGSAVEAASAGAITTIYWD